MQLIVVTAIKSVIIICLTDHSLFLYCDFVCVIVKIFTLYLMNIHYSKNVTELKAQEKNDHKRRRTCQNKNGTALPTLYAAIAPDVEGGDYYGPAGWKEMRGVPLSC